MKKPLVLSLLLLLALTLAACGSQQTDAVPMPTDGGDEAQIQLDATTPLVSYLDLSQLSQETLSACTQVLNLDSQDNGVTGKLSQAMGDAMTLYLAMDITYPAGVDLAGAAVSAVPTLEVSLTTDQGQQTSLGVEGHQTAEDTMSYILSACYSKETLTQGTQVTLAVTDSLAGGSSHTFQWTVETQAPFQYADLKDGDGAMVGTVALSPFALSSDVWKPGGLDQDQVVDNLVLLDLDGNAIPHNAAGVGAGTGILHLEYRFFSPVDLSAAATVQIGPYSAQLNP